MNMSRAGLMGSLLGIAIGCTCWLIILGFVLKSASLIILPVVFGIIGVVGALKLYDLRPARILSILGVLIIWLMVLNFVLANSFYGLMPETIWKGAPEKYSQFFMTGKAQFSILFINTWLSIFTIAGLVLVVVDIVKKKQN